MTATNRLTSRSVGDHNAADWLAEGDGLLAAARLTRENWAGHRRNWNKGLRSNQGSRFPRDTEAYTLLTGLPRASMLLLGYAGEMYLKAGLVKAYRGCLATMFSRDIKKRFGHDFVKAAEEVAFPERQGDRANLTTLTAMVLVDARYPVHVAEGQDHAGAVNARTNAVWSDEGFATLADLVGRLREHASLIDSGAANPATFKLFDIDQDGYLAFRVGGHLPPRVTYRRSSQMLDNGETSPADVKALIAADAAHDARLLCYWDRALILEDKQDRTTQHQSPAA